MGMTYTNVKLPIDVLYQFTDEDIRAVIRAVTNHGCDEILEASTGTGYSIEGLDGLWEEGDIDFVDGGKRYTLAYDFMESNKGVWRVFRYAIDLQPYENK